MLRNSKLFVSRRPKAVIPTVLPTGEVLTIRKKITRLINGKPARFTPEFRPTRRKNKKTVAIYRRVREKRVKTRFDLLRHPRRRIRSRKPVVKRRRSRKQRRKKPLQRRIERFLIEFAKKTVQLKKDADMRRKNKKKLKSSELQMTFLEKFNFQIGKNFSFTIRKNIPNQEIFHSIFG